jgi:hypothetical protein
MSSTNTCGAISTSACGCTRPSPAAMIAIDAPSLWPTRIGASTGGILRASSCM